MEERPNYFAWRADPLYSPTGHPLNNGQPSEWDARSDPFHTRGAQAAIMPTQEFIDDRMPAAEDLNERTMLASKYGEEGSWGDRKSFMRAHYLVPDTYRKDVTLARRKALEMAEQLNNGEM